MIDKFKDNDFLEKIKQKARERTVKTQNVEYTPEMLIDKVSKGEIKINPDYQRNHRWDDTTSSRLIESLILNIPIPLVYLSQDIDIDEDTGDDISRYSIIDGQQRVTAIINFFKNKFSLEGLETLEELNGAYFKNLPSFLIRRLNDRNIKFLRIDSTLDKELKYEIFERLNRGSVNLEPQELRNSIFRGKFNDLLKDLAKNEIFRKLLHIKSDNDTKVKKMEDIELVLRFFAFSENENYKNVKGGKLEIFLSNYMEKMNNTSDKDLNDLKIFFEKTMNVIFKNFNKYAFAKYNERKTTKFNKAVFDALAIAIAKEVNLDNPNITQNMKNKYLNLFKINKTFMNSITGATISSTKIEQRIDIVRKIFRSK